MRTEPDDPLARYIIEMILVTLASLVIGSQKDFQTPEMLVEASNAFYQGQFANLKLAKMGKFGVSRMESSQFKTHSSLDVDPAVRSKSWMSSVGIYGSHGKPLNAKTLSRRYHRLATGVGGSAPKGFPQLSLDADLIDAIDRFRSPMAKPLVIRRKSAYAEIRPVRLSKPECLKCHADMKLGDPVALMVWVVSRKKQTDKPIQRGR